MNIYIKEIKLFNKWYSFNKRLKENKDYLLLKRGFEIIGFFRFLMKYFNIKICFEVEYWGCGNI